MKEKIYTIEMTKDEMLKFYVNKIIEDGIRECSEFNISTYLSEYGDGIDLSKYKNDILQLLYRDERIADVMINDELCIDMVFYTSYCPYFYDEVNIDLKEEINILSDFYYYCNSKVYEDGYISVRNLINYFIDYNKQENGEEICNILKKNIVEIGFIDKYIEKNNETFVTLNNENEFKTLLEIRINELEKQYEKQLEDELQKQYEEQEEEEL